MAVTFVQNYFTAVFTTQSFPMSRIIFKYLHVNFIMLYFFPRKVSLFETEFDLTEFIHGTCRCLVKVSESVNWRGGQPVVRKPKFFQKNGNHYQGTLKDVSTTTPFLKLTDLVSSLQG